MSSGGNHPDWSPARLLAALQASGDVVYEWDLMADTLRWSGAVDRVFTGEPPRTGAALSALVHPEDLPERVRGLNDHIATGTAYDCEYRLAVADGEHCWVQDRGALNTKAGAGPTLLSGILRPVTLRKQTEARLEYLANFDELTGHFNKKRLQEALDGELRHLAREDGQGGFAVLGVDQLAIINSAYGYEAGDAVLIEVGRRLSECLRAGDVTGRLAGDRFGALLPNCDKDAAHRATERVVEAIHSQPVETPAGSVRITVTAGVVTFPTDATFSADIIAKAESALREAKLHGRNQAGVYEMTEAQRASYRAALDIGAEVEDAMSEDRLTFAYQPIFWTADRTPHSHECLLRLRRRDGEILSAGQFVPAVEQLGLVRALDRKVLLMALDRLQAHPHATLAINISGLTANDPAWLETLFERLAETPSVARRLIIEITETAALQDIAETARFVRAVRELGCRVALDDFGAGYTNFLHLKRLTVDIVKIDGSFIRELDRNAHNRMFVRNLITLAASLDVMCVAECVETAGEANALAEEGAPLLQGFHLARPALAPPWEAAAEPARRCVRGL